MVRRSPRVVASVLACLAATLVIGAAPAQARVPRLHHAWVFVMENHSLHQILGNPKAPFLNRVAHRYRVATHFYAPAHPSLPNYLAMISGSTHGCASDRCTGGFRGPTLARQLTARGLGWQGYFEGLPHRGYMGANRGRYIRHHNPFVYFRSVTSSHRQRRHLRKMRAFSGSLRSPPGAELRRPEQRPQHAQRPDPRRRSVACPLGHAGDALRRLPPRRGDLHRLGRGPQRPLGMLPSRRPRRPHPALHHLAPHPGTTTARRVHRTTYSLLRTLETGFRLPHLGLAVLTKPLPRAGRRPRTSVMRAPPPARFAAATVPPCASAIARTIARPRPDPSWTRRPGRG